MDTTAMKADDGPVASADASGSDLLPFTPQNHQENSRYRSIYRLNSSAASDTTLVGESLDMIAEYQLGTDAEEEGLQDQIERFCDQPFADTGKKTQMRTQPCAVFEIPEGAINLTWYHKKSSRVFRDMRFLISPHSHADLVVGAQSIQKYNILTVPNLMAGQVPENQGRTGTRRHQELNRVRSRKRRAETAKEPKEYIDQIERDLKECATERDVAEKKFEICVAERKNESKELIDN